MSARPSRTGCALPGAARGVDRIDDPARAAGRGDAGGAGRQGGLESRLRRLGQDRQRWQRRRLNHSTGGFLLGTDARLSQHWRAGALAGYSRTRFDVGNASGSSDNFHLGLYGGAQWGRLGLRLGAAHTACAARVASGGVRRVRGRAEVGLSRGHDQVFGDLGYRIDTAVGAVEPFVSAAYVNLRTGRIDERGAAALRKDRIPAWATRPWACAHRARSRWAARPRPRARRWLAPCAGRYDAGIGTAICGGDAFTAAGVPIARNAALIEAGMDVTLGRGPRWAWRIRG